MFHCTLLCAHVKINVTLGLINKVLLLQLHWYPTSDTSSVGTCLVNRVLMWSKCSAPQSQCASN